MLAIAAFAAVLAYRNLRAGRADVRGAVRLSLLTWPFGMLGFWMFAQPRFGFRGAVAFVGIAINLFYAMLQALCYLALEPLVRRRHPEWLTSWTRLLDGRPRDPLVGRDVLLGACGGVVLSLLGSLRGVLGVSPENGDIQAAAVGGWTALAVVLRGVAQGCLLAFIPVLLLVLLQTVTRRERLGWLLWWPLATFLTAVPTGPVAIAINALCIAWFGFVLVRAGLLGAVVAMFVYIMFNAEYLTTDLGAWFAGVTIAVLLGLLAVLLWGATAATRGPRIPRAT
jgi:hypothetical protein